MASPLFKDGLIQFRSGNLLMVTDPADCDCCGEICSDCVVADLPASGTLSIVGSDGCECFTSDLSMTQFSSSFNYRRVNFEIPCAPGNFETIQILCIGDEMQLSIGGGDTPCSCPGVEYVVGTVVSCDPLHITFPPIQLCDATDGCCAGYITCEFTE